MSLEYVTEILKIHPEYISYFCTGLITLMTSLLIVAFMMEEKV